MITAGFETIVRKRPRGGWWKAIAAFHALVGVVLAGLGGAMLVKLPWSEGREHIATRNWPTTEARILAVSLHEERHPGAHAESISEMVLGVAYKYEVDGSVFEGTRASFSDQADPFDRRLRSLYRKLDFARIMERTVPVSYDPSDPSSAYLDREFDWNTALMHAGIASSGVIAGFCLLAGTMRRRDEPSSL